MFKKSLFTVGLLATSISNVQALPYGFYDARSVAMGNVSVATGGITTAALSNPGMLAVNESDDKVALLFPAIGVQAIDDGNVIDLMDEFQDLEAAPSAANLQRQADILNELDGASVIAAVIPNAAVVFSGDDLTWGVTFRADAMVSGGLINVTDVSPLGPNPNADVQALGILVTEIGFPLGKDFNISGLQVSFGITPRFVQVDAVEYEVSVETADIADVTDELEQDLGSFTTVDAGITLNLMDTLRVGLVAKNLIEETKTTSGLTSTGATTFGPREINFDTHLRAGAAIDLGMVTLAADMDLTERKPVLTENPSKSLSVGAEIDAFNTVQIRAGYQTNLASGSTDPDLLSVGVGIWLGFNLDIAVVAGEDSSFGGFIQTGFHF